MINKIQKKIFTIYLSCKNYVLSWRMIIFLWVLLFGLFIFYIFLFFSAERIQTLITFPGRDINLKEITNHPAGILLSEKVSYTAPSGNTITGLYVDNNSRKVVYYFHGNGAPIEYFYSDIKFISDLGYSVIALEYPGYGDSTGLPYIEENRGFAQVFYENMQDTLRFKDKDVIIWGYSVGTALAVDFAAGRDFDSLVLFSPLASRYDMAKKAFGFPIQKLFFLENSYVTKEIIKTIDEPTLIVHGNTDKVVPFEQGKLVYENSSATRKKFIEIDDFGHSLIPERYGEVLQGYIKDFLNYELEVEQQKQEVFLSKDLAMKLLEKFQKAKKIENLDFQTDDSLTKYVDPSISFTEKSYIPHDLRRLQRNYIVDIKGNAQLREEAAEAFEDMAEAFYNEFGEKVVASSTYRSYSYQAGIKARGCPDHLCAKAGHSEHQSGLSIDIFSISTKTNWDSSPRLTKFYNWFAENAHLYGYHNTYRNEVDIDGYDIEPWHWRYLGVDFATYLKEEDITFAEHYYK